MTRKSAFWLMAVAWSAILPFANKGLTNDDLVFLDYAKRLTWNPTVCQVTDYVFLGREIKDLIVFESTHPPLVPYVLKVGLALGGENLVLLHVLTSLFLLLATLSLGDLIARATRFSPFLALGVTLGPMFLPNATGLMTDSALFAFWLTAMACWERAEPKHLFCRWSIAGIMSAGAAIFTAYQGLGLVVVCLIQMGLRGRLRHGLVWVLIIITPFALWLFFVWQHYGIVPYFSPPRTEISIANEVSKGLALTNILLKARALNYYIGAGLIFFLPWLVWRKGRSGLLLAACGWGVALSAYLFGSEGLWINLHASILAAAGLLALAVLADSLKSLWLNQEGRPLVAGLLVSLAGFTTFQVLLASFAAPRYNLVSIAVVLLLALKEAQVPSHWKAWTALVLTVTLGGLVALAEKHFADGQRINELDLPKDQTIYVAGEKGLHYNGALAGYRYYLPRLQSEVSYLLVPEEYDHVAVPEAALEKAEVVQEYVVQSWLPIRVMSLAEHAGFYIHNRGMLPFVFSKEPIDILTLYRTFQPGHENWLANPYESVPAGEVLPGQPVIQDFTCLNEGLTRIHLMLATYNRQNASTLTVRLYELDANNQLGPLAFEKHVAANSLSDNAWASFEFPRLPSKGKRYRLELSSPDATPATAVTIWTNANADGQFMRGTEVKKGALAFESQCLP